MEIKNPNKVNKFLKCRLTQDEFNDRAEAFADVDAEITTLEAEKKDVADTYKKRIGGREQKRIELRRIVKDRAESREVACTWHEDWASKTMLLRRDDTEEVVDSRAMTPAEYQHSLDLSPEDRRLPSERDGDGDDSGDTDGGDA